MLNRENVRATLECSRTINRLAAIEHERWAHWQQYLHDQCVRQEDGSLQIPVELVARWEKQIQTHYEDLTPEEQESDREQVHRYLPTVINALSD